MSEKTSFEKNILELEEIVKELEDGKTELSKSLELFEKGIALSAACTKMLDEAEQKVNILLKNDSMKETAFVSEDE